MRNLLRRQFNEVILAKVPQLGLVAAACSCQEVVPRVELSEVALSRALSIEVGLFEVDSKLCVVLQGLNLRDKVAVLDHHAVGHPVIVLLVLLLLHKVSLLVLRGELVHELQLMVLHLLTMEGLLSLRVLSLLLLEELGLEQVVDLVAHESLVEARCTWLQSELRIRLLELLHSLVLEVVLRPLVQVVLLIHYTQRFNALGCEQSGEICRLKLSGTGH